MISVAFKKATIVARKFSEDGPFELCFECNCDLIPAIFFAGKTERAEHTGFWTPFKRGYDASIAIRGQYCITINCIYQKQVSIKDFQKEI